MTRKTKVYISGPISGLERADYMARFAEAERWLREAGYDTCNPTRLAPCRWTWLYRLIGYRMTLWYDLAHLMTCDAIAYLPGWQDSQGASIEHYWAAYRWRIFTIAENERFCHDMKEFINSNPLWQEKK